jgi:plastocyanin
MNTGLLRGGLILILAASMLAACTTAGAGGPAPSAPPGGAVVTARNTAFDSGQLAVPAGTPFQLLFDNRDGAPHNVTIFDDGAAQPLFVGEVFAGPASRVYRVPAIPAGTYRFRCDVHLEMTGTVTAGGAN